MNKLIVKTTLFLGLASISPFAAANYSDAAECSSDTLSRALPDPCKYVVPTYADLDKMRPPQPFLSIKQGSIFGSDAAQASGSKSSKRVIDSQPTETKDQPWFGFQ